MNRTRKKFLVPLMVLAALLMGGCAASAPVTKGAPTLLVELIVTGGGAPTPQQVAKVNEAIAPAMARAGLQFARSLETADYVLMATFTPDAIEPNGGRIGVISFGPARVSRNATLGFPSTSLQDMQQKVQDLNSWAAAHSGPDR